ncbi:DUF4123 domain-containing protein [Paraburkholderia phenoliruptrix]|uniref:DUF4123 domain-containing protein n=1 Tax=Paraburkholderia phenoliruptrix TaxID=252970 RepID=UPI003D97F45F
MTELLTQGAIPSQGAVGMRDVSVAQSVDQRYAGWQRCFERLQLVYEKHQAREQTAFLYLIADGRGNPGIDNLLARVPELSYTSLWRDTAIQSYTDVAPYLIALDRHELVNERSLQHRLARRLWREASVPMLTWLWSPHDLESVASHYRRYAIYSIPNRQAYYLHFYDNRVLERLKRVWTEEEAQQFIAPCLEIGYCNRLMADITWENAHPPVLPAAEPLQLTDAQHQLLIDLAYTDKLTLQLRTTCGARLDHLTPSELYQLVCSQLERASAYRINDETALLNFVTCGVLISPAFDEHPVVRERLLAAARGDMSSVDALSGVTDDVWSAVQQETTNA